MLKRGAFASTTATGMTAQIKNLVGRIVTNDSVPASSSKQQREVEYEVSIQ